LYIFVYFYKNYFQEFFLKQNEKVRSKIIWTLELIQEVKIKIDYENEK